MQTAYERCMEQGQQAFQSAPWTDEAFYSEWLAQTYYFVCHSTRLLAASASRMNHSQETMFRRFVTHVAEEQGHEHLAENDLKALGRTIAEFPERPLTRAFYESQYCKIYRQDPSVFLGYVLLLEGLAAKVGPGLNDLLTRTYGTKASNFIRVHADNDPDHVDHALELIGSLSRELVDDVRINLIQSCDIYCRILKSLKEPALLL